MSVFDQRGQHVNYQYNAAGNINFGTVQNSADLAAELEKLKPELAKAREAQAISEDTETEAKYNITKAAQLAKAPQPDKKSVLDYLNTARDCLKDITAVGGIVESLSKAAAWVQGML